MLIINNLEKSFGTYTVLKDINLEFGNGVYGLLAPNGAGKTTLIKLLTTLIFPTKGEILYDGEDIVKLDDKYRDIIGYLPQQFGYYKDYTAKKFLAYIGALKGLEKDECNKRIDELLEMVSLSEVKDKKLKKFSGGMLQRVGIAQALLNNPKIVVLDEPTAGLDPKERVRFRNLLSNLSRDKIIIISTHIVSDIEFIADEVIMIKDKGIRYKDSVENICDELKGKIFETKINIKEMKEFEKKYITLSEKRDGDGVKIRFISRDKKDEWVEVEPNLEDVFLYEYNEKLIGE
ncbi:ATP-binding cassette domain-containing protein [uncultured Clostridium sp.]|uniref:ATP-binding cassette domain-containing protein n=1 Tax=uncultured Clostridium sp. TaxID=59620 RepID=UPI002614AD45|nr:ATP-binding cassette domain-containing protein [uncultured Clostridium sp.]